MNLAGLWVRWVLRDMRSRWIHVVAIAFIIALGTGTYSGLSSTTSWRLKSNNASFRATNMHDLKVTLGAGSFVPEHTLVKTLSPLIDNGQIAQVEERLSVPTQVRSEGENGTVMTTGRLVGMDFSNGGPHIDSLHFIRGGWSDSRFEGRLPAAVDYTFSTFNNLPDSGVLQLPGGMELQTVGLALSPEYFIAMDESGSGFSQGGFAVIYVPNTTVQAQSGLKGMVNDAVILAGEAATLDSLRESVTSLLEAALPDYGFSVTTKREDRIYRLLYEGADADQQFYNVIGVAILAAAVFAAFNLTSRIVQAQRREIGIGMAMGSSSLRLAMRPLLIGVQISLLGVILGVGIGVLVNSAMRTVLETMLPMPIWLTPFEPTHFAWVALGAFIAPMAAIGIPIFAALRMRPIEAIRTGHLAPVRKGLAPLMSKVPLPGNTFWQIPFRNLLRAPRRSLLTLIGVSAVIAVMMSVLGMLDSFVTTLNTATHESEGDGQLRLEVTLDKFTPTRSPVITAIETDSMVKASQPVLKFGSTASTDSADLHLIITAIDFGDSLWTPTIVEGNRPNAPGEIVLSTTAARNLDVRVGDFVTVGHPVMTRATSVEFVRNEFVVTGLHPHPVRAYSYVHTSQAATMGMAGVAQSMWIYPSEKESVPEVKSSIFAIPGVAAVFESSAQDKSTAKEIEGQMGILKLVQFIVLGLTLLIAFNTASINMDDRAREHATMMAFGLPIHRIMRMAIVESMMMGALASVLGIGLGLLLLNYFVYTVFPTAMPEIGVTVDVSMKTVISSLTLGIVAVGIAPLLTIRKLLKTNIPSTLRIIE